MPEPTLSDRLNAAGPPTFSFEYFPPADAAGAFTLVDTVINLAELRPDWVSVTYGATGSTRERTFDAVRAISRYAGVPTMGHLTVAGQTTAEVAAAIDTYAGLGVRNILALRGDPPDRQAFTPHEGGLRNATDLVRLVASMGDFTIGVAAFPDGHPDGDPDLDVRLLLDKQEAGASFAVSQLFFDAEAYLGLVDRFRALGGTMPIIAGIMPVTNPGQIERFGTLSGSPLPEAFTRPLLEVADDKQAFRERGLSLMTRLCDDVLAAGAPGLQFFTLNRSTATQEIVARLRQMPPRRS